MRIFSPHTEKMLLLVACGHKSKKARNFVLARTEVEDFGTDEGKEIRKRFDTLLHNGRKIPGPIQMAEDSALTSSAREILLASTKTRKRAKNLSVSKIKAYLHILRQHKKIRIMNEGMAKAAEICKGNKVDEDDIDQAIEVLTATVADARRKRRRQATKIGKGHTVKEAKKFFKKITTYDPGQFVPSGIPWVDHHMGGLGRGDLVVISAPPGGGKSALMAQLGVNQYKAGCNVGLVNLEMNYARFWERVVANISNVDHSIIHKKKDITNAQRTQWFKEWVQFAVKHGEKHNCVFYPIFVSGDYKPQDIELELGPLKLDVIYIDYLTLLSTKGYKEIWQAQKAYSRYLKLLAAKLDCAIVILTQLSADFKVKYGKGPEEDADWWFWWPYGDEEKESGNVEIHLAKSRHGRTGTIKAQFELAKMRIHLGELERSMSGMKRAEEIKNRDVSWTEDEFPY